MENEQYYIYGKLNQSEILKEYESKETDTAKTEVDNTNNTIAVNVKAVPGILHIFDTNYPLDTIDYDGSINKELDLSKYVDEIKLTDMKDYLLSQDFARAELKSESDKKNVLHFYRASGEEITSVELSGFTQIQSDLSKIDPADEAFVKNKSTKYLVNDGENGTSAYATQKWTQDEISKHSIDLDVVKDISLSQNETPDYLAIKKDSVNLNTRLEKSEDVTLPLATNSKSGLMSSTDVNAISDLKGRVENLEGKTTRLLYSENENPTVEQINTFVENAGYTSPFEGIAVVVDKTFHIWHYYENIGWQDDGQDTVSTFTNNTAGIIKGSEIEGRVYAENDGTGSLVGYDNLKNKTDIIKNDGTGNTYLNDKGEYTEIVTNRAFPKNQDGTSKWKIDGTTLEFIQNILADNSATVGMSYLGGVKFSNLPEPLDNAECLVEIISSTLDVNAKVIHLDLYSATTKPYHWSTIYYTSLPDPIWSPDVMESEITTINTRVDQNTNNISGLEIDVSNINTKLDTIQEGAEVNTINSISLNGSALTPDSNKNVNILESIPVITGTQEKPINLATDLEVGKYYFLQGYIFRNSTSIITIKEGQSVLSFKDYYTAEYSQVYINAHMNTNSSNFICIPDGSCSICLFFANVNGIITQTKTGYSNISVNDDSTWSESLGYKKIYAPTRPGKVGQVIYSTGIGHIPEWIDQTSIKSKQQTYYLAELPTITTSPYAEHDQVVVNNQDVYALEKVDSTLTWVKKYSVGGENESIITLIGTQEKPINLATDLEVGKYYVLKGNTTQSTGLFNTEILVYKYSIDRLIAYNANVAGSGDVYSDYACSVIAIGTTNLSARLKSPMFALNRQNYGYGDNLAIYAPTTYGTNGQILSTKGTYNGEPVWIDNPAPKTISNTAVSNWTADTTYADFGYKADISITNLTENDTCEVIFNQTDASSGNYAQVNSSSTGTLTIYSKVNTEITIPTIIIIKGGY